MSDTEDLLNATPRARRLLSRITAGDVGPVRGLVDAVRALPGPPVTLLCVCPVTPSAARAALQVALEEDFPLLFAATLNQVDRDGGYTGWTPAAFRSFLVTACRTHRARIPVFVGLDHGGPWCRDDARGLPLDAAMQVTRASIEACLDAGYAHLHIDATLDPAQPGGAATTEAVLLRTAALIAHAESYRVRQAFAPVTYEVSAERESGSHVDAARVEAFVGRLVDVLRRQAPALPVPIFTVANLGTDLHSPTFDARHARSLADRLQPLGTYLKGHFTDFVSDPGRYPVSGVAAANLGPELAAVAFGRLRVLAERARSAGHDVPLEATVTGLLDASGRWRKWLLPGETAERMSDLPETRQAQIVETASRYVLNDPRVVLLRDALYEAAAGDPSPDAYVLEGLRRTIRRYARAFNLSGLCGRLLEEG